jgi:hypothetical protein
MHLKGALSLPLTEAGFKLLQLATPEPHLQKQYSKTIPPEPTEIVVLCGSSPRSKNHTYSINLSHKLHTFPKLSKVEVLFSEVSNWILDYWIICPQGLRVEGFFNYIFCVHELGLELDPPLDGQ